MVVRAPAATSASPDVVVLVASAAAATPARDDAPAEPRHATDAARRTPARPEPLSTSPRAPRRSLARLVLVFPKYLRNCSLLR